MPPVYDIAAGQIQPQIVSSIHQGKAMRLALENARLANESTQQEIDYYGDEIAIKQQDSDTKAAKYQLDVDKHYDEMDEQSREHIANASAAAEAAIETGEDPTKAFLASLPDDEEGELGDDFQYDSETGRAYLATHENYIKTHEPKTPVNVEMPDGSVIAVRPQSSEMDAAIAAGGKMAGTASSKTEMQKELQPLVDRGVITQEQMDELILAKGKKDAAPTGDDGVIESKDSALIMRAAHASYGGLFGPNNELMPLEKGIAKKMTKRAALAERLYIAAKGQVGHQTAVEMAIAAETKTTEFDIDAAAKKLGVSVEDIN